ncbi:MAG: DUF928 domain-containing protein, partial [Waterburya sp.]
PKRMEQRRTICSGSRSTCLHMLPNNSVKLLVPKADIAHKTSLASPSFYVQSSLTRTTPLKFTLIDPYLPQPVAQVNLSLSQKGITKIDLPQSTQLKPEKIYLWYVIIPCQNGDNQSQEVLNSLVKFSPMSPAMPKNP